MPSNQAAHRRAEHLVRVPRRRGRPGQRRGQVRVPAAGRRHDQRGHLRARLLLCGEAGAGALLSQRPLHPAVGDGEAVDHGQQLHLGRGVQPGAAEQAEEVVDVAQRAGPERRRGVHEPGQPRMPLGDVPALPGQVDDGLPGVRWPARRVPVLAADVVDHELDQVFLGRHVVVQRHRAHAEGGRDAPHGDRVQALGVGQCHRGRRDGRPAVPGLRPPAATLRDIPDRQRRDCSRPRWLRRGHHLTSPPGTRSPERSPVPGAPGSELNQRPHSEYAG